MSQRLPSDQKIAWRAIVVTAVFGVFVLCVGMNLLTSTDVECGNMDMQPGQQCVETSDSGSVTSNYESARRGQKVLGGAGVALGVAVLLGAVLLLVFGRRAARRAAEALRNRAALAGRPGWVYRSEIGTLNIKPEEILDLSWPPTPQNVASGPVGGLWVHVFDYLRSGRPATAWVLELRRPMPTMVVWPAGTESNVQDWRGFTTVPTGDAEIDQNYTVRAHSTDAALAVLSPTVTGYVRATGLPCWGTAGTVLAAWADGTGRATEAEAQIVDALVGLANRLVAANQAA